MPANYDTRYRRRSPPRLHKARFMPTSRASVSIGTTRPNCRSAAHIAAAAAPKNRRSARCVTDPERPLLQAKQRQEQHRVGVDEVKAENVGMACDQPARR
jgi:hypothetical protein